MRSQADLGRWPPSHAVAGEPRSASAGVRVGAALLAPLLSIPIVDQCVTALTDGPLTRHMLVHIVLMNVLALLAARVVARQWPVSVSTGMLAVATLVQLAALWAWHSPLVLQRTLESHTYHLASAVSLTGAAMWFWISVLCVSGARRWLSICALLLTAKLFCLLAALLVLAPRTLVDDAAGLEDQQLAGLMMIIACPLTYVTAGVIISARWLAELAQTGPPTQPCAGLDWKAPG